MALGQSGARVTRYRVAAARPDDLELLPGIELAAARLLTGHAPDAVLEETTSQDDLRRALHGHRLWVVLTDERPVGFAHLEVIEPGSVHLEEIDVHPAHGRRGLGTRLMTFLCRWAAVAGYQSITLTTFRDVPWNMPFYSRLGFESLSIESLSPALGAVVEDERRRGLDVARRVVMRRTIVSEDTRPGSTARVVAGG